MADRDHGRDDSLDYQGEDMADTGIGNLRSAQHAHKSLVGVCALNGIMHRTKKCSDQLTMNPMIVSARSTIGELCRKSG